MISRLVRVGVVASAIMLLSAAVASAAQRYASPGGSGTSCTQASPCDIFTATNGAAVMNGDEVILLAGPYNLTMEVDILKNIDVHGQDGQPAPTIATSAGIGIFMNQAGASIRNVRIDHTGAIAALQMSAGTADQVFAHTTTGGTFTCNQTGGIIRDSVCFSDGGINSAGVGTNASGVNATATLRNVTAVASGSSNAHAVSYGTQANGDNLTVDAKSVIASSTNEDVSASASTGATTTITLDHSNYDSEQEAGAGTKSVTNPGTPTNQTAAPLLVAGDFHQLAGSPTIDAGAVDASSGTVDIDGEARTIGAAPDIGADEFNPPAPPPLPLARDSDPPEGSISNHPKKKTHKRKGRFEFGSDEPNSIFQCNFDRRGFAPCESELRKKFKPGKHTLLLLAIDSAGNADPTPDVFKWKVLGD